MKQLIKKIQHLKKSSVSGAISRRLEEFSSFSGRDAIEWFSELCFCILTANSRAKTAVAVQEELGPEGFLGLSRQGLAQVIRKNKHRFHNAKAAYILEARKHKSIREGIKDKITCILSVKGSVSARDYLADNIKGIGYKEASHFLRNTGTFDLAVLDRHILRHMHDCSMIEEMPKTLSRTSYLEIEARLSALARALSMPHAELDLYLWYLKTGEVLK